MAAAYLVYSSYMAAWCEKLRRARQGMFPCQALRSFSFYSFNPREYPTRTVWQNPQIQLAHPFFCYAYLQPLLRVVWLKHQHMRIKNIYDGM